ncbi:MAG TPA: cyclic nucleotide-binding domain-containing protein [Acidimicrobiales bacterium]|nr:cyclic nucleotide-binding domain-containing protein [Acidimicrobiales bacterium]
MTSTNTETTEAIMIKQDPKVEQLARFALFSACSKKELQRLATIVDRVDIDADHVLCREGAPARECFFLIDGEVQVSIGGRYLGTVGAGEVLGEMALLNRRPRVATAVTTTRVSTYVIHTSQFRTLVEEMPGIALSLLNTLSDRLAELELATA